MPTSASAIPTHIAVIMDGNGRWAKQQGLPRIKGHEEGSKSVGECVEACNEAGVKFLTLYAFSAENWQRPKMEVAALMKLLERFLKEKTPEMIEKNIRLLAIGRLSDLPRTCQQELEKTIAATADNSALTLTLALSYSGRNEIVDAVRKIAQQTAEGKISPQSIDDGMISSHLYTAGIPDPDLLIRTSGEMRLSNFLLWQLSYTELYVTETLWPAFRKPEFKKALESFAGRHRRFGEIAPSK